MSGEDAKGNCLPTELSRTQSVGLAFVVESGLLSMGSLILLAGLLVRNIMRYRANDRRNPPGYQWSLVQEPAEVYILSLFFADLLQAIGASMSAKWVHSGIVETGTFCRAQGFIQQLGETTVGLATAIIAIHTFVSVWMRKRFTIRTALIVTALYWIFVILFVSISTAIHPNYDEPTPYWCWVGPKYKKERIAGEYFWLWFALIVSFGTYVPLFLWNRGNITIDEDRWWKVQWHWIARSKNADERERPGASSLALLSYPVAYSVVVLPVSVVRWITFGNQGCGSNSTVPSAATFATVFLHDLFGFVNVLLLLTTRQTLLLFGDPQEIVRNVRARAAQPRGRAPSPSPSSVGSHIGMRRGVEVDDNVEMAQRLYGGGSPTSPAFLQNGGRAASLDSSRDALGIARDRRERQPTADTNHTAERAADNRRTTGATDNGYNSNDSAVAGGSRTGRERGGQGARDGANGLQDSAYAAYSDAEIMRRMEELRRGGSWD